MLPEIVPSLDSDVAALLRERLSDVDFHLGARVERIDGNTIHYSDKDGARTVKADTILMSVGRRPVVEGMGLENTGLDFSPKGIVVDEKMRTNLPGVWAAG